MASDKERDPGLSSAEIGKYLDILAKDPNSRVFAPLAEAYRKAGLFDDAVEIALEGLKVHPNYLGGRVALGRAYFEKKQYADAAAEMQKVVKAAPDNIIAHKVLGQIAYQQNNLPAAEKSFKMVLLLDPRDQEAQQFIANLAGGVTAAPAPVPVQPALARPASPPQPPPVPPPVTVALQPPFASPPVKLPPPPPLTFNEIEAMDDLDLQADDIFGSSENPPPPAAPSAALPAAAPLEEFGVDEPLDVSPDSWLPEVKPPAAAIEAVQEQPAAPDGGMKLEVFSRVPWGAETGRVAAPPPTSSPPPPPVVTAEEPESPFEVFGRPKRGGPPQSTRGEQLAFGEIDLESTADEPVQSESVPDTDSPFEVFTRAPGLGPAPAPARLARGGGTVPRELDIETTAYTPPETFTPGGGDAPLISLDEELPRTDLTEEIDLGSPEEPSPSPVAPSSGPESEPLPETELEPKLEMDLELDLASDQELEDFSPPSGAAVGRGVFDTETLASIYIDQGFYGRAAEIYQRLITERPDDPGLRRKLEGVLALERGEAENEEPLAAVAVAAGQFAPPASVAPAPGEPAAVMRTGSELMISQLQTLLETFKGGRP